MTIEARNIGVEPQPSPERSLPKGKLLTIEKAHPQNVEYNGALVFPNVMAMRVESAESWWEYRKDYLQDPTKKQKGPFDPHIVFYQKGKDNIWRIMKNMPRFPSVEGDYRSEDPAFSTIQAPNETPEGRTKTIFLRVVVEEVEGEDGKKSLVQMTYIHEVDGYNIQNLGDEKTIIAKVTGKDHRIAQVEGQPGRIHLIGRRDGKIQLDEISYEELRDSKKLQEKINKADNLNIKLPEYGKIGSNQAKEVIVTLPDDENQKPRRYLQVIAHTAYASGKEPNDPPPLRPDGNIDWDLLATNVHYDTRILFIPLGDRSTPFSEELPLLRVATRKDFPEYTGTTKHEKFDDVTFPTGTAVYPDKKLIQNADGSFSVEKIRDFNPDKQTLMVGVSDATMGELTLGSTQELFNAWYKKLEELRKREK